MRFNLNSRTYKVTDLVSLSWIREEHSLRVENILTWEGGSIQGWGENRTMKINITFISGKYYYNDETKEDEVNREWAWKLERDMRKKFW